ncbi:MAG: glyceraldehyde 3-phosphate dehydrogenase NAD-binding domain-containing protein, partial [Rhabdochlamydiaceae bacterium]
MMKIAINGFGRIGRLVLRIITEHKIPDLEIIAINDLVPIDNLSYLLKYDTVHHRPAFKVEIEGDYLIIDGKKVHVYEEKDPLALPWKKLNVDYVIESTGRFIHKENATKHLQAGARRVVITAPAKDDDTSTYVMGVNHEKYDPSK